MREPRRWLRRGVVGALAALTSWIVGPAPCEAATYMRIYLNESKIIRVDGLKRVSVTNPSVATPVIISPSEIMLNGLTVGRTSLYIWDAAGRTEIQVVVRPFTEEIEAAIVQEIDNPDVNVRLINERGGEVLFLRGTVDTEAEHQDALEVAQAYIEGRIVDLVEVRGISEPPAATLKRLIDSDDIKIQVIMQPGSVNQISNIILEGFVDDQRDSDRAVAIAQSFASGGGITNLLEVVNPLQVMVEAHLLELVRTDNRDSGVTWGTIEADVDLGGQTVEFGEPLVGQSTLVENFAHLVGRGPLGGTIGAEAGSVNDLKRLNPFFARLRWLQQEGKAKILENPKVVTRSGETASISVGGEVGAIVSAGFGSQAAEFRNFGLDMSVTPEVDHKGNINTATQISLSTVDQALGASLGGSTVPGFRTRSTQNTVSVKDGEHIIISGLINREEQALYSKVPFFSKIPVLGKLFQSKSFQKSETELVVIITPHLLASKKLRERFYQDDKVDEIPESDALRPAMEAGERTQVSKAEPGNEELVQEMFAQLRPGARKAPSRSRRGPPGAAERHPDLHLARAGSQGVMISKEEMGFPKGPLPIDPMTGDAMSPMQAPRRVSTEDTSEAIQEMLAARRRSGRGTDTRRQLASLTGTEVEREERRAEPAPRPSRRSAGKSRESEWSRPRAAPTPEGMRPVEPRAVSPGMLPSARSKAEEPEQLAAAPRMDPEMAPPEVPDFAPASGSITRRIHGLFEEAEAAGAPGGDWSAVRLQDPAPQGDARREHLDQRVDELFQQIRDKLEGGGL